MNSEMAESQFSNLGDLVSLLGDEEVFAWWEGVFNGYLVLPERCSNSLILLYCTEREMQGLPIIIVTGTGSVLRRVIVGSRDLESFRRQLQFAVEKGGFVNLLRPDRGVFTVLVERGRAEELARELAALSQRGD